MNQPIEVRRLRGWGLTESVTLQRGKGELQGEGPAVQWEGFRSDPSKGCQDSGCLPALILLAVL